MAGRYTVDRELARGGAARVFLAHDTGGTPVALKILHPELVVSVTADRFLREMRLLSGLDHPRIASLLDSGEAEWLVYLVMTYVPGPSLREHLTRHRRASVEETARLTRELLDALEYAHERGIVHRDVKPDNVMLSPRGAVLLDFGIARAIASAATDRLTRSGFAVGTSAYMSPEQVEGADDLDHRSDLYSLGCVVFECLAGRPPFVANREELVLRMHVEGWAPDVRTFRPEVPAALAGAIARSLANDRDARWQSAREMREGITGG